jgi:nucleoside-specific outer membrane channel protein Tsx
LTLQHAGGFKYGRNFFFVDMLRSNERDNNAGEVYGEWYTSFSLSKIIGANLSAGIIRDVNVTAGVNYGAKNTGANPRVFLPGITVDFNIPGFAFFNVDFLAYVDHGNFKPDAATTVANCGGHHTSLQITPSWKLPFNIGPTKWSFEGFLDHIGSRGTCETEILTQPQLRLDVGNFWGKPDTLFVGIEYQYWHNKFGIKDLNEHNPQALLVWKF